MKKIGLKEFAEILKADPALSEKVTACSREEAPRVLSKIAGELGYELEKPPVAALSDDELGNVAGGRNPFLEKNGGELNPYSWFVSLLRMLLGKDDDENNGSDGMSFTPRQDM